MQGLWYVFPSDPQTSSPALGSMHEQQLLKRIIAKMTPTTPRKFFIVLVTVHYECMNLPWFFRFYTKYWTLIVHFSIFCKHSNKIMPFCIITSAFLSSNRAHKIQNSVLNVLRGCFDILTYNCVSGIYQVERFANGFFVSCDFHLLSVSSV